MTDTDLYQIVKDHREAWPERAEWMHLGEGNYAMVVDDGTSLATTELAFEASFHRAIQNHTYSVLTEIANESARVTVQHHTFDAPTLIEAYAKALEWLK